MPYQIGDAWVGLHCVPEEGSVPSTGSCVVDCGLDDCVATLICVEGTCEVPCTSTVDCDVGNCIRIGDVGATCHDAPCDPLAQDCIVGEACVFVGGTFQCADDDGAGGPGDQCVNEGCLLGLQCVFGFCTPFCDLEDPTACAGNDVCDDAPLLNNGDVGVCVGP